MPEGISIPPGNRRVTIILLVVFVILLISVLVVGLNDAPGYILGYLTTAVLFFTVSRNWRKIKSFIILFAATFFGILFLSLIYVEVIYRLAEWIGGIEALYSTPMEIITTVFNYVILFGGPVGMLVGILGTMTLAIFRLVSLKKHRKITHTT